MSYLGPLRLQFSGQFQSDPSTVNNDARHFNNATFQPQFQQPSSGMFMNGWWAPDGGGSFRLVGCTVTQVSYRDGTIATNDPVLGMAIADANARVAGKIVDLDPQQQLVSEIWGLIVRLTDGNQDYFSGAFAVAAFSDMWSRAQGPGSSGDSGAGTFWQSVIGPVTWGDIGESKFLRELRAASPEGMLSIKFNVDGYNGSSTSSSFTLGRIAGTIGPAPANEPKHFVLGRQLFPQLQNQNLAGPMNFMPAVVDVPTKSVIADFGNALPTSQPGGPLASIGTLELGYLDSTNAFQSIGAVAYQQTKFYPNQGGIQPFPLTDDQMTAVQTSRLAVALNGTPVVQENDDGLFARADTFVFRLEPEESAYVELWATQYGNPLPNATLVAFEDASGLQPGIGNPNDGLGPAPPFGEPKDRIEFPRSLQTDAGGRATLTIRAHDPGNKRVYVDGQVYGVRYFLRTIAKQVKANPSFGWDPSDFVSLHVYETYLAPEQPAWSDLEPIFRQYANLYPIMDGIVRLSSYESVAANAHLLAFAFALPIGDPNHMPVSRDLSRGKRDAILRWLANPIRGEPLLPPPPPIPKVQFPPRGAEARPAGPDPRDGAKVYAAGRRGGMHIPGDIE